MISWLATGGAFLAPILLRLLPWAGPRTAMLGIALSVAAISHSWVAYKVYSLMADRQEQALIARDAEWKREILRSNAEFHKQSEDAIRDAETIRDPANQSDINRLCDKQTECRDKGNK